VACVVGLAAVYCKYMAGDDTPSADYQLYHPLWHTFVCLASDLYIANQARVLTQGYSQIQHVDEEFKYPPPLPPTTSTTSTKSVKVVYRN